MNYKTKTCLLCDCKYTPTNGRQKYCVTCKPIALKNYLVLHSEERKANQANYFLTHREQIKANCASYYLRTRDTQIKQVKQWTAEHREKVLAIARKKGAKRKNLGFVPLNGAFPGCAGHHMDRVYVVYIPVELHRSIWHNVWTGKNMDKINDAALQWLAKGA